MNTFSDRLKSAREAAGMTQAELAKKAGFSHQSAIANMEAGRAGSRGVGSLAHALGVDAYWLETGKGARTPAGKIDLPPHLSSAISTLQAMYHEHKIGSDALEALAFVINREIRHAQALLGVPPDATAQPLATLSEGKVIDIGSSAKKPFAAA